jgi:predicted transcriptional regulator
MGRIEDIKQAAAELSTQELAELRAWLEELEEQRFDEQREAGLYPSLSADQRKELERGIAEAERGEVSPEDEVFRRLEQQFDAKLG